MAVEENSVRAEAMSASPIWTSVAEGIVGQSCGDGIPMGGQGTRML